MNKIETIKNDRTLLEAYGTPKKRVLLAVSELKKGRGVILIDNAKRENESDIIFSAETMTVKQMALTIRHGSGIVCLCLTKEKCQALQLPMMVKNNTSTWGTNFTITIEAAQGVTTGVSASDRITTIKTAIADNATASDLHYPGHVFPLCAHPGGVLSRNGHTEATLDLLKLAGLKPVGVLCELINDDGSMARIREAINFSKQHNMPIVTIEDLIYFKLHQTQ